MDSSCLVATVQAVVVWDNTLIVSWFPLDGCVPTKQPMPAYTLIVPSVALSFVVKTALIPHGIDSTRSWKHPSEILIHTDMIQQLTAAFLAAHPW